MQRTLITVFSALFLLFALSALSAQTPTSPQRVPAQKNAPRKQVHPNIDPQTARSTAKAANQKSQARQAQLRNPIPSEPLAQYTHDRAPVRVRERNPENPVRFAFAPRDRNTAAPMPWDRNPSAGAVMSTFLTGEISPELVDWHINQRKKTLYEKNHPEFAGAASQRTVGERSEYGEMLHRMEFVWGNRTPRAEEPAEMYGYGDREYYTDPSNGSILVQLLTGYKNGEIQDWKENRALMARRSVPRERPAMPGGAQPMYAYGRPIPQGTALPAQPYAAPYPAYAYGQPLPPNGMPQGYEYTSSRAVTENFRQGNLSTMPSENGQVRVATAEQPRFVDDGFPSASAAPRRNPIRQVSAEFRTPAPRDVVGGGERVSRAGQIRIYTEDEDGWSPVE